MNQNPINPESFPQAGPQKPFCSHCGAPRREAGAFCTHCGKSINPQQPHNNTMPAAEPDNPIANSGLCDSTEVKESLVCNACGTSLPEEAKFCMKCGLTVCQAPRANYRIVCAASGKVYAFDLSPEKSIEIGKSQDCDIVLENDEYTSRSHARLFLNEGDIWIEDLNSSNGTFVKIDRPVRLKPDSEFLIGKILLSFENARGEQ